MQPSDKRKGLRADLDAESIFRQFVPASKVSHRTSRDSSVEHKPYNPRQPSPELGTPLAKQRNKYDATFTSPIPMRDTGAEKASGGEDDGGKAKLLEKMNKKRNTKKKRISPMETDAEDENPMKRRKSSLEEVGERIVVQVTQTEKATQSKHTSEMNPAPENEGSTEPASSVAPNNEGHEESELRFFQDETFQLSSGKASADLDNILLQKEFDSDDDVPLAIIRRNISKARRSFDNSSKRHLKSKPDPISNLGPAVGKKLEAIEQLESQLDTEWAQWNNLCKEEAATKLDIAKLATQRHSQVRARRASELLARVKALSEKVRNEPRARS